MNFIAFEVEIVRSEFLSAIEELLPHLKAANNQASVGALDMIAAIDRNIDVMERVNADSRSTKEKPLKVDDINQIGDYALTLLDELSNVAANQNMQQSMLLLHRLSIPVAMWIADHGGKIAKLDVIVNAIASYANELTDAEQLAVFCEGIRKVVFSVTDDIKMDMEATNPMRPWRILNLNWGIVATRSHNAEVMEMVFDQLIKNIPADARQFFKEGMQQMEVINYPDHVKVVMEKYNNLFKEDSNLH
jgi:hypothetical protein